MSHIPFAFDQRSAIRICHVQVLPILSGVQRAMLDIFKQLDRDRYELHVACQGRGPLTDELERQGIRWHAVPALDRAIHIRRDWQAYRQLCHLFREIPFDIVHTHSSKPGVLGRLAARRANVTAVLHHVHSFAFHEFSPCLKRWLYSRVERWGCSYCDRLLFVNHEERKLVVESGWLPAEKCHTVYNGVSLARFNPRHNEQARRMFRQRHGLEPADVAVVFVGRLDYPKQPLLIPEIARELELLRPDSRWQLLIVGDGGAKAGVADRIDRWNLGHRVQLLGWQSDPHDATLAADIVLLTSLAEGLPLALIEAQAAGRPIVAGNAKGVREVVTPGTGYLCPPRNAATYATHLSTLIGDSLLRKQFGRAARQHAEQHFDTIANNSRIAALYEELLGINASAPALRQAA